MDTYSNDANPIQLSVAMNMLIGDMKGAGSVPAPHAGAAVIQRRVRLEVLLNALPDFLDDIYVAEDGIIMIALKKVRMGLGARHACSFLFGMAPYATRHPCMRRCFLQTRREADRLWHEERMEYGGEPSVKEQRLEQLVAALKRGESQSEIVRINIASMEKELNREIASLRSNIATPPTKLNRFGISMDEYVQLLESKLEKKTLELQEVPEAALQKVLLLPISCTVLFPSCRPPSVHRM